MVNQAIQEEASSTEDLDARLVGELDISIQEIMDEVFARASTPIPENSFDLRQFMSRHDVSEAVGRRILKEQVASGFLSTDLFVVGGRKTRIYWKA